MMRNKQLWEVKMLGEVCDKGSSNISINKIDSAEFDGDYPLYGASGLVKGVNFYHRDEGYIGIVKDGAGVGRVGIYPAKSSLVGTMQYIIVGNEVTTKYLYYVLNNMHLAKYASGATIPHIYFKNYGQERIPVPPLSVQSSIVSELDLLSGVIEKKKQQLAELDNLAQAIFYDMFGDPVTNEKGWEVKKLGEGVDQMHIGPFGSALKTNCYVEKEHSYCMVYEQKHAIRKSLDLDNNYISEDKYIELKRFEVKPYDFIMSCRGTIGELFQIPKDAPIGIIHPSLMKIRINTNIYDYCFFSYLLCKIVHNQNTNGGVIQMAITAKKLASIPTILPPLPLQQLFATKISSIENQKAKIKQSLAEAETLFQSRMSYYFD